MNGDLFNQQMFIEHLLGARHFARDVAVTRTASAQWGRQTCPHTVMNPDRQSWGGGGGTWEEGWELTQPGDQGAFGGRANGAKNWRRSV